MKQQIDGKIGQARLVIALELLWNAAFPALLTLMVFAVAVLSGALAALPDAARFTALAVFAVVFFWSLKYIAAFRWPADPAAIRRLEEESRLEHHPVAASRDTLADPIDDPLSKEIWEAHKRRQLASLDKLRTGPPRSGWKFLDPYAARAGIGLALLASLFLYKGDPVGQLADAVRISPAVQPVAVTVDAWIKPPAYTAKPPVMLTSKATMERLAAAPELMVPENSILSVRIHNAKEPHLALFELLPSGEAGTELTGEKVTLKEDGATAQTELPLTRPMHAKVMDGSKEIYDWHVMLIPDAPPVVSFNKEPYAEKEQLALAWKATDDYGIARVDAELSLSDEQDGGVGIASNGVFLFDPPEFPIVLKKAQAREITEVSLNDLTAHPWAGLNVDVMLKARDTGGRTAQSETKTIRLPERQFIRPLARALVEQRKALVMNPDDTEPVQRMLKALLAYPDGVIEKSAHYVAIRTVMASLAHVQSHDDIRNAIDMLWKIALSVEEGDLADAKAELEALRKELERALAEGASPERLAEIMKKMREAMDRYLDQMTAEAQRQMKNNPDSGRQNQQGRQSGQQIRPEDLQKMLDTIEKLARNGAKDAAQQMLSQLDNILRNLQAGQPQQMDSQRNSPMGQMLDELSELMRRQQQLMDDTQKLPENGGDQQQGEAGEQQQGQQQGQSGQNTQPGAGDLADQQQALQRMLQDLMNQMGQNGMQAPDSLGQAGKEMDGATGALGKGQRNRALGNQNEALNQLRQGAQGMARQMMQQQGRGNEGSYGREGEARGDDRDPLGRPMPTHGEDMGPERDMLPSEMAIRRAREILDMLRSRSNSADLPRIERDYLERLLRGLY